MSYPLKIKQEAARLRRKGFSIKEIAKIFAISQSTSSLWCTNIVLNEQAQTRLSQRKILGQYKAIQTSKFKSEVAEKIRLSDENSVLSKVKMSSELSKLCCALLFWCEGSKSKTIVRFTNSDPSLVKLFLSFFRHGFS